MTAICDNAYSGNYLLEIKSCIEREEDDCNISGYFKTEKVKLFPAITDRFGNFNISAMNMSISMQAVSEKYVHISKSVST